MDDRDKYLILELLFTLILFILAVFLLGEAVSSYKLYLIIGLTLGLYVSWITRDRYVQAVRIALNLAAFCVVFWIVLSIMDSSFLYKDLIVILIKGVITLEIIFSFGASQVSFLSYIQALSLPLFMFFPLLVKNYDAVTIISIMGYFLAWLAVLKVKFYGSFNQPVSIIKSGLNYSLVVPASIFIVSMFFAGMFFSKFPLGNLLIGGFFVEEGMGLGSGEDTLEKDYYDLQDKLLKEMTDITPKLGSIEDKQAAMGLLSYLIKESSVIMEVDKSEQGLISYLRTPGPGLEKSQEEEALVILKNYIDKMSAFNIKKIKDEIISKLKRSPFNIKDRVAISDLVGKVQDENSPEKAASYQKQLRKAISNSSFSDTEKQELEDLAKQLKEWKDFQGKRQNRYSQEEKMSAKIEKEQKTIPQEEYEAPVITEEEEVQEFTVRQEEKKDIGGAIEITRPVFDSTLISNKSRQIILIASFSFIVSLALLFSILYFLTLRQKKRLVSLCGKPNEYIISLYENAKALLMIFGVRPAYATPPRSYAELTQSRLPIKTDLFSSLTLRFEEAKYSRHMLSPEDGVSALNDYNNFLKELFCANGKSHLFFRYLKALIHRRPVYL